MPLREKRGLCLTVKDGDAITYGGHRLVVEKRKRKSGRVDFRLRFLAPREVPVIHRSRNK